MGRLINTVKQNNRAKDIYQWCLDRPNDKFIARDVDRYSATSVNIQAMKLLVDRDLIMEVNCNVRPRVYKLKRTVPLESCLDVPSQGLDTTVTRYRVAPSVASEYASSSNLKQYAIG